MGKQTMGAVFVFLGVALVYAAASGHLQSAWSGLKGDCGAAGGNTGSGTSDKSSTDLTKPDTGSSGGTAPRAGRGGDFYYVGTDGQQWAGNPGSL